VSSWAIWVWENHHHADYRWFGESHNGRCFFDGQNVTLLSASERDVAMVFQFPTVYPHLSIYDNLALLLQGRGLTKSAIYQKIDLVIDQLKIPREMLEKNREVLIQGFVKRLPLVELLSENQKCSFSMNR
jgi:multiple sugar transport system ATP-binding protein